MTVSAIPLTVIGGYLGAGKTTLVNQLLAGDHGLRLAVIVNDFGDVAVDELLIEQTEGGVVALANGCVCCTVSDGLGAALESLVDLDPPPDHIIVEVSGVGDPWAVAQWGRTPGLALDGVVVVIEPESVRSLAVDGYVGDTVVAQICAADLLVVSRIDVANAAEVAETLSWLGDLTDAPVVEGRDLALEVLLGRPAVGRPSSGTHHHHKTWTFVARSVRVDELRRWLVAAPIGIVRVKGVFESAEGPLVGQRVGRRTEITPLGGSVGDGQRTVLVVATAEVDPAAVARWCDELRT